MKRDDDRFSLDFRGYIAERTRDFVGRKWLFAEIDRWLADPDAPQMFILTGEPGIGVRPASCWYECLPQAATVAGL